MKASRIGDETWTKEGPNRVLQAEGTKPLRGYINNSQATLVEWVALWKIFGFYAKETGYAGGGKFCGTWWRKEAAEQQLGPR